MNDIKNSATNISLGEFIRGMESGGIWVLADASSTMKNYTQKHYPDTYDMEIKKYRTPLKFIKVDEQLVVVSVSKAGWSGVYSYNDEEAMLREKDDQIIFLQEGRTGKTLVSSDSDNLVKDMISTGYISQEEYEMFSKLEIQDTLTIIAKMVI